MKITTSAICGTDLHMVRGPMTGMKPGTVVGHEAAAEVVEVGPAVRDFEPGDRVVVPSTISCGYCSYCRAGYQSQCDNARPQRQYNLNAPRRAGELDFRVVAVDPTVGR